MIEPVRRDRGFALLIVLWSVALLALLEAYLVATARDRLRLTYDAREAAGLEAAADGAVQQTIFKFLDQSASHWNTGEPAHGLRIGTPIVSVSLEAEDDKINPNFASVAQLRAVLEQASSDAGKATVLAAAIVAWRTPGAMMPSNSISPRESGYAADEVSPGRPFRRLDDVGEVPGMTPELLASLWPHLSLYTGSDPDLESGTNTIGAVRVIRITAVARGSGKSMFTMHVIVKTNARRSGRRYEILMSERDTG